ncbi:hypothetical protein BpHYR1_041133 [Brachionus plicatilis]|uniref:Uncharacterized protein n=1 Tax=Brachionus plicatilis TaxID=10195 RepID=A0A3M7PZZ4_BRAPC|nr:hypothetical protein BpHYR1_041133 [Brachionus plicatilis]
MGLVSIFSKNILKIVNIILILSLIQVKNYFMPVDLYSKVLKYKSSDLNYLASIGQDEAKNMV